MPTPVIKRFNDNLTLGTIDQLALVYFPAKSPSAEEIAAMQAHLNEVARRAPEGFGLVLHIPAEAGPPEGKAREQASEMFRSFNGRLKLMTAILEGEGFAAAAKRSVLTVLVTVALRSASVKVFSSVPTACEWTALHARGAGIRAPSAAEVQACVEQMCRGKVG